MKDMLSEFGSDHRSPQVSRAKNGGVKRAGDVNDYQKPLGPKGINDPNSPGLHGKVHHCGSQGSYTDEPESGGAGLGGEKLQHGSQK